MNNKLKEQARKRGYSEYLPLDIFFSQLDEKEDTNRDQVSSPEKGINIKPYFVSNAPVKNAMRPIHKMIDIKHLSQ